MEAAASRTAAGYADSNRASSSSLPTTSGPPGILQPAEPGDQQAENLSDDGRSTNTESEYVTLWRLMKNLEDDFTFGFSFKDISDARRQEVPEAVIKAWAAINAEQVRMIGVRQGNAYTSSRTVAPNSPSVSEDFIMLWKQHKGLQDDSDFVDAFPDYETAKAGAPAAVAAAWQIAHRAHVQASVARPAAPRPLVPLAGIRPPEHPALLLNDVERVNMQKGLQMIMMTFLPENNSKDHNYELAKKETDLIMSKGVGSKGVIFSAITAFHNLSSKALQLYGTNATVHRLRAQEVADYICQAPNREKSREAVDWLSTNIPGWPLDLPRGEHWKPYISATTSQQGQPPANRGNGARNDQHLPEIGSDKFWTNARTEWESAGYEWSGDLR